MSKSAGRAATSTLAGEYRINHTQLLSWYARNKRDLPWRRRQHDAYAQLLAELMLQQTQVATVIDYYRRFMRRFPSIEALAAAELDDVLTLWSGLGYYRRARHLHAAARAVVESFGGTMPDRVETLMTLPGIGRYTAGIIASVVYGVRAPVLDGNVRRVLARLFAIRQAGQGSQMDKQLWTIAEQILPVEHCGDFNQALMELGATVCSPRAPRCPTCPLQASCEAHTRGLTQLIPSPAERKQVSSIRFVSAAVRAGQAMLFVQRPAQGLWAGLWELPTEPLGDRETPARGLDRLRRRLPPGTILQDKPIGKITRQLTHRNVTFHLYRGLAESKRTMNRRTAQPIRWMKPHDLGQFALSQACHATLRLAGWPD